MKQPDIVVTCSGGLVTGVFGPENANVLIIDYDNIKEGDSMPEIGSVDGTPDCKECLFAKMEFEWQLQKIRLGQM